MPEYSTTTPYWRSEILEKKKRKRLGNELSGSSSVDLNYLSEEIRLKSTVYGLTSKNQPSLRIPEWKRDLIKRIHTKKAQERDRMESGSDEVVEEHIPKVTENVFLVQEKQHTKSLIRDNQSTMPNTDALTTNVVIIENDQTPIDTVISPSMEVKEMPSSGIVSRLMNKFEVNKKHNAMRYRSKSTSNLRPKQEKPRVEEKFEKPRTLPMLNRGQSVDVKPSYHISNVVPIPYHKSHDSVIKSPVLSPKAISVPRRFDLSTETIPIVIENDDKPIDTSLLHAHGEVKKNKLVKVDSVEKKEVKLPNFVSVSEPDNKSKLPNGDNLHSSGNQSVKPAMKEELVIKRSGVRGQPWRSKKENKAPTPSSFKQTNNQTAKKSTDSNANYTKPFENNVVKNKKEDIKSKQPAYSSYIEEFEETNIDESELNTPEAKFVHAILKNSQTIQINPRKNMNKNTENKTISTDKNKKVDVPVLNNIETTNTVAEEVKLNGYSVSPEITTDKTFDEQLVNSNKENELPASSIDDIVIPVEVIKENEAPPTVFKNEDKLIVSVTETKEVKPLPVTQNSVKSPTEPRKLQNVSSMFGTRVHSKSSPTSGKSFVIDPSKFKKSSAAISTVKKPVATKRAVNRNITVIGGYVTLERSCLVTSESKKKKKKASISFNLEEITHQYVSEKSLIEEHTFEILQTAALKKPNTLPKDSTFGKYTPKYLLSMSQQDIEKEKLTPDSEPNSIATDDSVTETVATPTETDGATKWSEDKSADILF